MRTKASDVKMILRHHSRSFVGCFSLLPHAAVHWGFFLKWKNDPASRPEVTEAMAQDLAHYAQNQYDCVVTAPPSLTRNLENYCTWFLADSVAGILSLPFVKVFAQRKQKKGHGVHKSLEQEPLEFIEGASDAVKGKTVLWVDDFMTSGITAQRCYLALREVGCHVDGLVWAAY